MGKQYLDLSRLLAEARDFSMFESQHQEASLFGTTDGKAIGTYIEKKFSQRLQEKYYFSSGNSASGIDFPELGIDIKTTSVRQPQSSSPFKAAWQKIYGLGYSLLVFVYDKQDDSTLRTSTLHITDTIYVDKDLTSDYQMTLGIAQIIENNGNQQDIFAFLMDKKLPLDEDLALNLAEEIIKKPPHIGCLTMSNALQWRLQYQRAIKIARERSNNGVLSVYVKSHYF